MQLQSFLKAEFSGKFWCFVETFKSHKLTAMKIKMISMDLNSYFSCF